MKVEVSFAEEKIHMRMDVRSFSLIMKISIMEQDFNHTSPERIIETVKIFGKSRSAINIM